MTPRLVPAASSHQREYIIYTHHLCFDLLNAESSTESYSTGGDRNPRRSWRGREPVPNATLSQKYWQGPASQETEERGSVNQMLHSCHRLRYCGGDRDPRRLGRERGSLILTLHCHRTANGHLMLRRLRRERGSVILTLR